MTHEAAITKLSVLLGWEPSLQDYEEYFSFFCPQLQLLTDYITGFVASSQKKQPTISLKRMQPVSSYYSEFGLSMMRSPPLRSFIQTALRRQ